jgi:rubrerythrin
LSESIEDAITNAIEYETKVRNVYKEAEAEASDSRGKRVLKVLADEEQRHLDYLEHKLKQWKDTGVVTADHLETVIPSKDVIEREVGKLRDHMHGESRKADAELRMLNKALKVEIETGDFYKRMVKELSGEGQKLFARFVEIEEGHRAIVQAEIDYISGSGFWFDFREFDLEAGG